jgi:DNA invertase Pin-like site-specific DNA recombinase
MIIGYARVSTAEQILRLRHDDIKPAFDASVDQTRRVVANEQADLPAPARGH